MKRDEEIKSAEEIEDKEEPERVKKEMWNSHGHNGHSGMLLAHAYVLWQCYDEAFCPQEALMKGTLFPELYGVYPIPN